MPLCGEVVGGVHSTSVQQCLGGVAEVFQKTEKVQPEHITCSTKMLYQSSKSSIRPWKNYLKSNQLPQIIQSNRIIHLTSSLWCVLFVRCEPFRWWFKRAWEKYTTPLHVNVSAAKWVRTAQCADNKNNVNTMYYNTTSPARHNCFMPIRCLNQIA